LWGERLFEKFAYKGLGKIDYEEFVQGLGMCTKATEEDKLKFLFSLYDLRGDGYIDKAELVSMVPSTQMLNTYKHTMRSTPISEVTVDPPPEDNREPINSRESMSSVRRLERKMSASIHRDDFALPDKIDALAGKIMLELEAHGRLDFEQFARYVRQNPRIMEVFTGVFREELWSNRIIEGLPENGEASEYKIRTSTGCFSCLSSKSTSILKAQTGQTTTFQQEKAGWLHRKLKDTESTQKLFGVIRTNMLLLFLNPSSPLPTQVLFLEGCYIDKTLTYSQDSKPGFTISSQFEGAKQSHFTCKNKEERDDWIQRLEGAAKSRRIDEFYQIKDRIGSGKFSDVHTAIELQTSFQWAVKIIDKKRLNESEKEMLRSEVAIMRLLNHPNVVEMKEVFEDKNKMYVVMELVEGGELFEKIRSKKVFSEYVAFHITRQLLYIVKYLHEVGIVHRDIKPENILLSDDSEIPTIKLADFGLSQLVGPNDQLRVPCGTLAYVAPEVLMQRPYGKAVDMWSVGVVTYLMLRGRLPFDSKDKDVVIEKTIEAKIDLTGPHWSKCTNFAKDFVSRLLTKEPADRMNYQQALDHNWIRNGEVLVPRKINRRAVEEDMLRKTITNAKMQPHIYDENPKSTSLGSNAVESRFIYTTPDIFEDMEVERKLADHSLLQRRAP
jgi:serine/threonine protein kinase